MAEGGLDEGRWEPFSGAQARRVGQLRRELVLLEHRYGMPSAVELEPLERALRRRSARLDHLTDQLDELIDEVALLEQERQGLLTAMEAVVSQRIDEIRRAAGETWSPFPVMGWRLWGVLDTGLVGAVRSWPTSTMRAECHVLPSNPDVPHTDPRCPEPSCGIHAMKSAEATLQMRRPGEDRWAMGLVALSGKVVEHDRGYRAAQATVEAVALVSDGRAVVTADPGLVDVAFTATADTLELFGEPARGWNDVRILDTLEAARRRNTWTSDPDAA